MGQLHYKGYVGSVEYDEENNSFFGHVLGLNRDGICYEGATADELLKDFHDGVDDYLAHCAEKGKTPEKSYSGKTVVRMTSDLHQKAASTAHKRGISLNEFINLAIAAAL